MDEIWHPLEQFDGGGYEISNLGNLRRHGRPLKTRADRYGYPRIALRRQGKRVLPTVHSLVAGAFIGLRPIGLEIGHLDGVQTNNVATNLAYVTPRENRRHSREHGTLPRGETHGCAKLSITDVEMIIASYVKGDRNYGANALARLLGVNQSTILRALKGKNWADARRAARALAPSIQDETDLGVGG